MSETTQGLLVLLVIFQFVVTLGAAIWASRDMQKETKR